MHDHLLSGEVMFFESSNIQLSFVRFIQTSKKWSNKYRNMHRNFGRSLFKFEFEAEKAKLAKNWSKLAERETNEWVPLAVACFSARALSPASCASLSLPSNKNREKIGQTWCSPQWLCWRSVSPFIPFLLFPGWHFCPWNRRWSAFSGSLFFRPEEDFECPFLEIHSYSFLEFIRGSRFLFHCISFEYDPNKRLLFSRWRTIYCFVSESSSDNLERMRIFLFLAILISSAIGKLVSFGFPNGLTNFYLNRTLV